MDLTSIRKQINNYQTVEAFCDDIRLIWKNCYTFNASTADVVSWAQTLSDTAEELIEEHLGAEFRVKVSKTKRKSLVNVNPPVDNTIMKDNDDKELNTSVVKKMKHSFRQVIKEFTNLEHADVFMYPVDSE